jgi:hypothetical protein
VNDSPYIRENRLQDVVAALQFLSTYPDYDLDEKALREKLARDPRSASDWATLLHEHPEFFRRSEMESDFCLVLRRAKPKDEKGLRPPVTAAELSLLIDTAIHLHKHALELKRERRAWLPLLLSGVGIVAALAGTILGAVLKSK